MRWRPLLIIAPTMEIGLAWARRHGLRLDDHDFEILTPNTPSGHPTPGTHSGPVFAGERVELSDDWKEFVRITCEVPLGKAHREPISDGVAK